MTSFQETSEEDKELGTPTVVTNRRRYMEICQETDIELPVLRHRRRLNSTGQLTSTPSVETSSTDCMREQDVTCSREQPVGEIDICSNQSVEGSTIEQPFNDSSGEQIVSDSSVDCIREEPVIDLNTEQTGEQLMSEQRSDTKSRVYIYILWMNIAMFMINIVINTDDNALKNWIKNVLWGDPQTIIVQRDRLMQTTLRIVCKQSFSWTSPFRVVFSGEIGDDMGGPRREFMW
ncbi:hypothetical protein KUTeg_012311 [Tegillarca granosa]|uniref:Uncharacterized protein n=1 Tax=Tegillarca granosa TaxID=220873 RepID=A0ABQ9EZ67_TEGGR|nr:hypothetical protein KUTeg_012311 [Tegillarca granosa]